MSGQQVLGAKTSITCVTFKLFGGIVMSLEVFRQGRGSNEGPVAVFDRTRIGLILLHRRLRRVYHPRQTRAAAARGR